MRRTIGVNTWVWTSPLDDDALAVLAAKAAGMGFGAIELPVEQPGDWSPDAAADVLAEHGLAPVVVGAMGPGRNLVAAPGSEVVATQNYLVHCVGVAERLGSARRRGSVHGRDRPRLAHGRRGARRRATASCAPASRPSSRTAERSGIRLAIEPLNRYETSLVNTVEQALDALGPLLGPGLGLALDSYHLNIEEKDIGAAIREAGEHLAHVQVCGNDRGAVGDDHIDWPAFLDALDDVGYDGPLGLESFTGENATIAVAASVWRPLAPSQDELAERSIRYLDRTAGRKGTTMTDAPATHPVTLFTGQWADLPFEEVARLAGEWGYDGLEIACSGDHLDLKRADEDDAYVAERREILDRHGLEVYAISNHLAGPGGVRRTRSTSGTRRSCARTCGATATPRACGSARPRT